MSKKFRGSAVLTDSNEFLFTPYQPRPEEAQPWKVVVINAHGTLRLSDRVLHLRATIPAQTGMPLQEFVKIVYNLVNQMEQERRKT